MLDLKISTSRLLADSARFCTSKGRRLRDLGSRREWRSLGVNYVTTILVLGFGFVNAVMLARWLGPEGRGGVAAAFLWPVLLPYLGGTGMIDALVYFGARPDANDRAVYGNAMAFSTVLSVVLCALGVALLPWLLGNQTSEVVRNSQFLLIGIPLTLYGEMTSSMLRAKLRLGAYNLQRLIVPTGYLCATMVLYVSDNLTLPNIVLANLVLYFIRFVTSVGLCRLTGVRLSLGIDGRIAKEMLAFGGKSHLGSMAEKANGQLDQVLIAAWLGPIQLGQYVVAVAATSLVNTIPQALKISILPQLAGQSEARTQDSMIIRMLRGYWIVAAITVPVLCVSLLWVIPLVFGADFQQAIGPAIILVAASMFFGAKDILSVAAKAVGSPWVGTVSEALALVATVAFLVLLLPRFGILGGAIASFGANLVAFVAILFWFSRARGIPAASLMGRVSR